MFAGLATGEFAALDARTGALLWKFQTGSGIHGSPMTYSVNGKQYVAVPSGWGGWMKGYAPQLYGANRGNALFVFALRSMADTTCYNCSTVRNPMTVALRRGWPLSFSTLPPG